MHIRYATFMESSFILKNDLQILYMYAYREMAMPGILEMIAGCLFLIYIIPITTQMMKRQKIQYHYQLYMHAHIPKHISIYIP